MQNNILPQRPMTLIRSSLVVFILSVAISCVGLAGERLLGIGWDFHPDAVTYVENSSLVTEAVLDDWTAVFNNLYYVIVELLDANVGLVISTNILLFGLANVQLWKCHLHLMAAEKKSGANRAEFSIVIFALILLNPYRIHLSTTMLKDTLIIYLLISSFVSRNIIAAFLLFALRKASLIYSIMMVPRRYLNLVCLGGILFFLFNHEYFISHLDLMHNTEMQFRDFDRVPPFSELGSFGILVRGIVWPLLALTGFFVALSPSFEMLLLALGSIFSLAYLLYFLKAKSVLANLYAPIVVMFLIALLVSGFSSYIRYVYPVLTILPIFICANIYAKERAC